MKDTYDPRAYFENTSKEERDAIFQSYIAKKNTRPMNTDLIMPVLCFIIAAVLLGLGCFGSVSQMLRDKACTQPVTATVTETAKGSVSTGRRADDSAPFQDVRYSYSCNGKSYTFTERIMLKKEAGKSVGETCTIYVDPNAPQKARFPDKRSYDGAKVLYLAGGLIFLFMGSVTLLAHRFRNS